MCCCNLPFSVRLEGSCNSPQQLGLGGSVHWRVSRQKCENVTSDSQRLLDCATVPPAMASQPSEILNRRPLLVLLSRGRCCRRASCSQRHISTPFASVSATSQAKPDKDTGSEQASAKESIELSGTPKATTDEGPGAERFTSLVQLESDPLITVIFPQWMVEAYQDLVTFGSACKRLFLPENGIKSKLPYYRSAVQQHKSTVLL